ncbi:MAG: DUF2092 domain-containing protein [gamma proteobacterium symbiont of Bathyaustriella thionipta]|nr:DUF2092 domain-containing protein [gamma proteobacterium symbiont of Bathyaustriella thionipta]
MAHAKTLIAASINAVLLLTASVHVIADDSSRLDPEADVLLKKMSQYMGSLKSFSTDVYVSDEQIMGDGFKMSVLKSGHIKIQRPDKLYISRSGSSADQESFFNGKQLLVYSKNLGMSINLPVNGDIDAALNEATRVLGSELPARDLISTDSYTPLMQAVEESAYLDRVKIGNNTCRHLAFRTKEVDWQLWVSEGKETLPCRYTITSKWIYAAPQYTVTFNNWKVNPALPASDFKPKLSKGTKSVTVEAFRKAIESQGDQ